MPFPTSYSGIAWVTGDDGVCEANRIRLGTVSAYGFDVSDVVGDVISTRRRHLNSLAKSIETLACTAPCLSKKRCVP